RRHCAPSEMPGKNDPPVTTLGLPRFLPCSVRTVPAHDDAAHVHDDHEAEVLAGSAGMDLNFVSLGDSTKRLIYFKQAANFKGSDIHFSYVRLFYFYILCMEKAP